MNDKPVSPMSDTIELPPLVLKTISAMGIEFERINNLSRILTGVRNRDFTQEETVAFCVYFAYLFLQRSELSVFRQTIQTFLAAWSIVDGASPEVLSKFEEVLDMKNGRERK